MGAAPMAYALWTRHLRHSPTNPAWPNRDRFVLSAGHASMLLYSLLHLTGYDVSLDDLKSFRQWGSITPGHPEYGLTPGVEATTGPLGQGLGNAIGMAIAERRLAEEFNRPGHEIIDHRTYVIASDGDMQEGIASEACSLAGHLKLGKLVVLYDDNRIQLDGPTAWAFSEDVLARFDAYGWHTARVEDGNDVAAISAAIDAAKADDRPSVIAVRTHIGFGSPNKQDTQKAHGAPLGPDEVGWPRRPTAGTRTARSTCPTRPRRCSTARSTRARTWSPRGRRGFDGYAVGVPGRGRGAASGASRAACPTAGRRPLPAYEVGTEVATRNASQDTIQALAGVLPELFGGSADLSESNLTDVKANGHDHFEAEPRRPQPALRRPRARDGRDRQRHRLPRRLPPLLRHLPHLQRLHARVRPAGRAVRPPRDLRLDARLGRPRRGRADAPAGRALRGAARDPEPVVRAPGRRERGGGGVGAGGRAADDRGRGRGPVALAFTRQKLPTLRGLAGEGARGAPARRLRAARGLGSGRRS